MANLGHFLIMMTFEHYLCEYLPPYSFEKSQKKGHKLVVSPFFAVDILLCQVMA